MLPILPLLLTAIIIDFTFQSGHHPDKIFIFGRMLFNVIDVIRQFLHSCLDLRYFRLYFLTSLFPPFFLFLFYSFEVRVSTFIILHHFYLKVWGKVLLTGSFSHISSRIAF